MSEKGGMFVSDVVHVEVVHGVCIRCGALVFVSDVVHVEVRCESDLQVTNESLETSL